MSYPRAERDSDRSLVVGWAGWQHLQQAMALAVYYAWQPLQVTRSRRR